MTTGLTHPKAKKVNLFTLVWCAVFLVLDIVLYLVTFSLFWAVGIVLMLGSLWLNLWMRYGWRHG